MCYHTKQTKSLEEVEKRFDAKVVQPELFTTSTDFNAFAYPFTPVITNEDNSLIQLLQWGLIPHWATFDWNRNFTLNARFETLDEKKSFKSITQNRCLIIVDGYYEWQHVAKKKIKYDIGFNNQLFALGGLYDINNGKKTYTIVTTEARGIMREIHNTKLRMPISLKTNEQMQHWLDGYDELGSDQFTTQKVS